jgi:hypothetical protein
MKSSILPSLACATWLGAAALGGLGCSEELPCGEGTHAEGDSCVGSLSPECGPGTKLQGSVCVPDQGGGAVCGPGTHSDSGTCVPDITLDGNAARLSDVNLTAPADIVGIANGPFHESFLSGENLLFIAAYQPSANVLRLFGGGGTLRDDGTYALDRASSFDASATFVSDVLQSSSFTFSMSAFGAAEPIVLFDTTVSNGTMESPEGVSLVMSGKLSGVLTPENAQVVYIESANQNMFDLLNGIEAKPDVDRNNDGTKESWTMSITFTTTPVWLF